MNKDQIVLEGIYMEMAYGLSGTGEASMNVKILPSDPQISRKGTIKLDFYDGDYYGLDSSLENGWLINRL